MEDHMKKMSLIVLTITTFIISFAVMNHGKLSGKSKERNHRLSFKFKQKRSKRLSETISFLDIGVNDSHKTAKYKAENKGFVWNELKKDFYGSLPDLKKTLSRFCNLSIGLLSSEKNLFLDYSDLGEDFASRYTQDFIDPVLPFYLKPPYNFRYFKNIKLFFSNLADLPLVFIVQIEEDKQSVIRTILNSLNEKYQSVEDIEMGSRWTNTYSENKIDQVLRDNDTGKDPMAILDAIDQASKIRMKLISCELKKWRKHHDSIFYISHYSVLVFVFNNNVKYHSNILQKIKKELGPLKKQSLEDLF